MFSHRENSARRYASRTPTLTEGAKKVTKSRNNPSVGSADTSLYTREAKIDCANTAGDKPPPYGKTVFHAQNPYQTCRGDHWSPVFALCAAGDRWSPLRVCKEAALRSTPTQKSRPVGGFLSIFYYSAFTMCSVSDAMTSSSLVGIMKTLTLEVGLEISVAVSGRGRFALCSASNSTPK